MSFRLRALLALLCGLALLHVWITYCPVNSSAPISAEYDDITTQVAANSIDPSAAILTDHNISDVGLNLTLLEAEVFIPPSKELPLCPPHPPGLTGAIPVYMQEPKMQDLEKLFSNFEVRIVFHASLALQSGGHFKPKECRSRNKVAIIVPFRDQPIHNATFNRAKLMNIGFVESSRLYPWDCFIFHDVDLMPEDDRNLYSCPRQPRHMSVAIDKFQYNLPYRTIFGGISALTRTQMVKMNGFSNDYWGWGGEDDDMSSRVVYAGYHISRYPKAIARYKMIKHNAEKKSNPQNPCRHKLMEKTKRRWHQDGLSNLKYELHKVLQMPLYTHVLVDVLEKESRAELARDGFPGC